MPAYLAFLAGLILGALVAALWMRTRLARLETDKVYADSALAEMEKRFQAAADAALRSSQSAFLDAARSSLDTVRAQMSGEMVQRQTEIAGVVKPLTDTLEKLDRQVRQIEQERSRGFGSLETQIQQLMSETGTLRQALQAPQSRGRWGEITLRRVAELAGMVANCDFFEQETSEAAAGNRVRPDMVVRLPGGRSLAVDAKTPLTAYLEAMEATDPKARRSALERHAQQVATHAGKLAEKQYWNLLQPAPEMVVLFLPGDQFFSAALEFRPELIAEAIEKKVLIATPVTLISILRGVAYGWQQELLSQRAEEIRQVAGEFAQRLEGVQDHYADVGRQLAKTVDAFNRSAGSWDNRLLPALRRLQELGLRGGEPAPALEPVDKSVRDPRRLDGVPGAGK